jgi:hypothetical protein
LRYRRIGAARDRPPPSYLRVPIRQFCARGAVARLEPRRPEVPGMRCADVQSQPLLARMRD